VATGAKGQPVAQKHKQLTLFIYSSSLLEFCPISLDICYHRLAQTLFVFLPNLVSTSFSPLIRNSCLFWLWVYI
jgi:hypothetical protein